MTRAVIFFVSVFFAFYTGVLLRAASTDRASLTIEGELLADRVVLSGGTVASEDMTGRDGQWSRGCQLLWKNTDVRDTLSLAFPCARQGTHRLDAYFTQAADYAIVSVLVNDKAVGRPVDGFAPVLTRTGVMILGTAGLQKGLNTLQLKIEGKNPLSKGYKVGFDRIDFVPVAESPFSYEGERLVLMVTAMSGGRLKAQDMLEYGTVWSNDSQLFWRPDKEGQALELSLPDLPDGFYEIKAYLTLAPDYGKVRLYLDNRAIGPEIDTWAPTVKRSGLLSLSVSEIKNAPGERKPHTLKIKVLGKNEKSLDLFFGLDRIDFQPL